MARRGYVQLVFQSTLPLRGATAYRFSIDETLIISIHTPLAGSDVCGRISVDGEFISIHTPLAGSDALSNRHIHRPTYFNPHSPCGERPNGANEATLFKIFQSTLPLRGATSGLFHIVTPEVFQSTLPLRGATRLPPPSWTRR